MFKQVGGAPLDVALPAPPGRRQVQPPSLPLTPLTLTTRFAHRWAAHRSTSRYMRHLAGVKSSRTVKALLAPLSYFAGVSVLAGIYSLIMVPEYQLPKVRAARVHVPRCAMCAVLPLLTYSTLPGCQCWRASTR